MIAAAKGPCKVAVIVVHSDRSPRISGKIQIIFQSERYPFKVVIRLIFELG